MQRLILIALLLLTACSRQIIYTDHGTLKSEEVKYSDILGQNRILESSVLIDTLHLKNVSCTHPGFCFNCGMKFSGKFECGVGWYISCPGHQSQTVEVRLEKDHEEFRLKDGRLLKTPTLTKEVRRVIQQTTCN